MRKGAVNKKYEEGILVAWGELFLKSKNVKKSFQNSLIKNINIFLKSRGLNSKLRFFYERLFISLDGFRVIKPERKTVSLVKRVFGISWFAKSFFFPPRTTLRSFLSFIRDNYSNWIKENQSFAIALKMEKNILKVKREKIIDLVASEIKRKVDLTNPSVKIFIEIRKTGYFLYFKKIRGLNGLPVGASGRALSLVSGGIDSPVASFLIAKRGVNNVWIHFHSFPLVSNSSIEKVKELGKVFLNYQPDLKIYFIPFYEVQQEIRTKSPAKYIVLLYRRAMLKIAEKIAKKENCQALVLGESLGQVSSQTLKNITITGEAVKIPILRPLIGFNKEEIIELSRKIGFFDISIRPHEDCCTLFAPKHQTAEANFERLKLLEKEIKIGKLIGRAVRNLKLEKLEIKKENLA